MYRNSIEFYPESPEDYQVNINSIAIWIDAVEVPFFHVEEFHFSNIQFVIANI